ncbi:hypothetical protein B0H14DRAFT_2810089 [Mycena olivaceomarginata]|nr:hypothetical protein B0H14DRAFT_2810089 [Mycena olivaceomarginata]
MAASTSIPALDPLAPANGLPFVIGIFSHAFFCGIAISSSIQDSPHPLKRSQLQLERHARFNARGLVMALIVLTALQTVMVRLLFAIVTDFDDPTAFEQWAASLTLATVALIESLIESLAQLFHLECCWRALNNNKWRIVVISVPLAGILLSLGSCLVVCVSFFRNKSFVVPAISSTSMSVWVISTAATNVSVATVLAYVAISSGKTSAMSMSLKPCPQTGTSPGSVSKRVAQLLVETGGCMSAVIGVLSLILYFEKDITYYILSRDALGPAYTLTVLVALALPAPDRKHSSLALTGPMERVAVKANPIVESDIPDGLVTESGATGTAVD